MNRKILFLVLALAGCAAHQDPSYIYRTQEVKVPVEVKRVPPAVLMTDIKPGPELRFVAPSDAAASSALTKSGERALRALIRDLHARLEAWKAWAK